MSVQWSQVSWHQFGYASLARLPGQDRGGWGVLAGNAEASEVAVLMPWVSTRIESSVQLPHFVDPAELRQRPVRLRAATISDRSATRLVLAHSIDAGPDATGRPGNVMSQIASTVDDTPRPIELWGSPDWRAPYADATSTVDVPTTLRPGPLDRSTTLAWVRSGEPSLSLGWVLDTVHFAHSTGRRVVLCTRTSDEAAHWLAAITHLTSRVGARGLGWSTFEDAMSWHSPVVQELSIAGMSAQAAARLVVDDRTIVVDPRWEVRLTGRTQPTHVGPAQGGWQLPDGRTIPMSLWQHIVLDLLGLDDRADEVLQRCDEIGDAVGADAQLSLYWALGVALLHTEGADVLERGDLVSALLRETPPSAPEAVLDRLLDEFRSGAAVSAEATGDVPEESTDGRQQRTSPSPDWTVLIQNRNSAVRELALACLVEEALSTGDVRSAPVIAPPDRAAIAHRLHREIDSAVTSSASQQLIDYLFANELLRSRRPAPSTQGWLPSPTSTTGTRPPARPRSAGLEPPATRTTTRGSAASLPSTGASATGRHLPPEPQLDVPDLDVPELVPMTLAMPKGFEHARLEPPDPDLAGSDREPAAPRPGSSDPGSSDPGAWPAEPVSGLSGARASSTGSRGAVPAAGRPQVDPSRDSVGEGSAARVPRAIGWPVHGLGLVLEHLNRLDHDPRRRQGLAEAVLLLATDRAPGSLPLHRLDVDLLPFAAYFHLGERAATPGWLQTATALWSALSAALAEPAGLASDSAQQNARDQVARDQAVHHRAGQDQARQDQAGHDQADVACRALLAGIAAVAVGDPALAARLPDPVVDALRAGVTGEPAGPFVRRRADRTDEAAAPPARGRRAGPYSAPPSGGGR